MIRTLLALWIVALIGSGGVSMLFPPAPRVDSPLQDTVDAMAALTAGLEVPENLLSEEPLKLGGEFDPNKYFSVLTHLQMEPGYTLDYVYYYDGVSGFPKLHARPIEQPSYQSVPGVVDTLPDFFYLAYIQLDDTPESYFELTVLRMMGEHFYRFGEAKYVDMQVIADSDGLDRTLDGSEIVGGKLPADVRRQARRLDLQPVIEMSAEEVTVSFITFTNWGGYYRFIFYIREKPYHNSVTIDYEHLISYYCEPTY